MTNSVSKTLSLLSFLLGFPTRRRLIFKLWYVINTEKREVHGLLHVDTKIWYKLTDCVGDTSISFVLNIQYIHVFITDCKNIHFHFPLTFLSNIYWSYFTPLLIKVSVNSSLYFWLITEASISQTQEAWWAALQPKHQDSHTLTLFTALFQMEIVQVAADSHEQLLNTKLMLYHFSLVHLIPGVLSLRCFGIVDTNYIIISSLNETCQIWEMASFQKSDLFYIQENVMWFITFSN